MWQRKIIIFTVKKISFLLYKQLYRHNYTIKIMIQEKITIISYRIKIWPWKMKQNYAMRFIKLDVFNLHLGEKQQALM